MPVQKQFRSYYLSLEWRKTTRPRILARAGNRCERCRVPNYTTVKRSAGGTWFDITVSWKEGVRRTWRDRQGLPVKRPWHARVRKVGIVLAVCHLNHTPGDDRDENLAALCQWCHLTHDREHHRETREVRKDAARPLLNHEQTIEI